MQAREAVVALGPQSGVIFRKLGYPIPLGIKRGHHLHFNMKDGVRLGHTVVDEEAGYVLAPMVQGVRLSTGIEFASPVPLQTVSSLKGLKRLHAALSRNWASRWKKSRGWACAPACPICARLSAKPRAIRGYGSISAMRITD